MSAHPKNSNSTTRPLNLLRLESRDVPAVFYVDSNLLSPVDGQQYTFNQGQANQVPNLVYGASEGTANAVLFGSLKAALAKAAANTEADTINLANGTIVVDNSAGEVTIADQISLVGSGKTVTTLVPAVGNADPNKGVLVVEGAATYLLNMSNLTFDGAGKDVGNAVFYIGSTGVNGTGSKIDLVAIKNVRIGNDYGNAVTIGSKSFAVVQRSEISGYGRIGVFVYDSDGWVVGNTITGVSGTTGVNHGVQITGNSYIEVYTNTISGNTSTTGAGEESTGVWLYEESGKAPYANVINNTFAKNDQGVRVGYLRGADAATATITKNNIMATNGFGVVAANNTLVNARRNYWDNKTGPLDVSTADNNFNPNSTGAKVDTQVDYATFLKNPWQVGEKPGAIALGGGAGGASYLFNGNGSFLREIPAFPGWNGEVRVATGDVNNDGTPDLVRSFGAGLGSRVQIYNGANGNLIREFDAYGTVANNQWQSFTRGVYVAVGDVNGDGFDDIIAGEGAGGSSLVKVWSGSTGAQIREFTVFRNTLPYYTGGVTVAAGDVNNDGYADIIAGTATQTSLIGIYDAKYNLDFGNYGETLAFPTTFPGGVNVAAGDVNGDGRADIFAGAPAGAGPLVFGWRTNYDGTRGQQIVDFTATTAPVTGGIRPVVRDLDNDGLADLAFGYGSASGSDTKFRIVNGTNLGLTYVAPPLNVSTDVFAFANANGVFVG
jgi:hypothetical protein